MNADWLPGNAAGIAYVNSISALGRMCDVTDIADIVGFLASHDGRGLLGKDRRCGGSELKQAGVRDEIPLYSQRRVIMVT